MTRPLALLVALAAIASFALPLPAAATKVQRAKGAGLAQSGDRFDFSARAAKKGATGKMTIRVAAGQITARVSCLQVEGDRALVSGVVTESPFEPPSSTVPGTALHFVVEDGGRSGQDAFQAWFGGTEDPCEAPLGVFPDPPPIVSGAITVR